MKKIKIFIFTTVLFFFGCKTTNQTKMDEVTLLKKQVDSLKSELLEVREQLDFAKDELQFKESEISYWGHKYDSCMRVLEKNK